MPREGHTLVLLYPGVVASCCCTPASGSGSALHGKSTKTTCSYALNDRYHRILDLRSFGKLVADGTIPSEGFTTLSSGPDEVFMRHTNEEAEVVGLFAPYKESKVGSVCRLWHFPSFESCCLRKFLRPPCGREKDKEAGSEDGCAHSTVFPEPGP